MQFVAVLFLGAIVAAAALAWRLSAGPVSMAFLTPYFESVLTPTDGRYGVRIDDTILDWSDEAHTLHVKLIGARVLDDEEEIVLQAPEIYVSLSVSALLRGEIAPRALSIAQPSLTITRTENGEFVLGVKGTPATGADAAGAEAAGTNLLDIIYGETSRSAEYLTRVNILHAELSIDDRLLGIKWSAPDVNISLLRTPTGLNGITDLDLKVGDQTASIHLSADYRTAEGDWGLTFGFSELRPSALASVSERLTILQAVDIPLGGVVRVNLDRHLEVDGADFSLSGAAGSIVLQTPVALNLPVDRSSLRGSYDGESATFSFDEVVLGFASDANIALPDPIAHSFPLREISAQGTWSIYANQVDVPAFRLTLDRPIVDGSLTARDAESGINIDATVKGTGFAFDDIARYWPEKIGANPRRWIVRHMPNGRIEDATAAASLHWNESEGFSVSAINGEILAKEILLDYLPPMPKIAKGIAHAKFNEKKFDIAVLGGESLGLTAKGRAVIDNLDEVDQWTDLDLTITGPLTGVLTTLDSEPFRFARAVGLSPRDADGETSTRLKMRFIAENRLTIDEIKVSAESDIKNASLPNVMFGLPMSDGQLKLMVDNSGLDAKGTATLGGLPSNIEWRENFNKKSAFSSRYRVRTEADTGVWREKIGLTGAFLGPEMLSGPIGGDIDATTFFDGRATISAELNLDAADLTIKDLGFSKPANEPATGSVSATLSKGKLTGLPKIALVGKELAVEAEATFASDGDLASARIARFAAGATDVSGTLFPRQGGWQVDLRGKAIDLKAFMEDDTPADPAKPRGDSVAVSVNVDRVRLYDDRHLNSVSGTISYDGLVVREAHLNGAIVDGGSLKIDIVPQGDERKVTLVSDNAGGVLRAFDVNDNVIGGTFNIAGTYAGMVPGSCLGGRLAIDNFRVRNAPILARLLNVASVVGLVDVLRGEGIGFDTLRVPFTRKDGVTRFENGKASGLSIGLTASGWTNSRDDTIEVEGEVIPANVLNGVLGKIPLVGGLFGGEGGIFAISYKVAGQEKEPDVSANPLTVLTPGVTRKIFNLFDSRDDETPPGCPKAS